MNFYLEINLEKPKKIQNPTEQEIKEGLLSLNDYYNNDNFIILSPEQLLNDCEFLQCIKIDKVFSVEIKLNNLNNPRIYFFETEDFESVAKIFIDFTHEILPELTYWQDSFTYGDEDLVKEEELCKLLRTNGLYPLKGFCEDNKNTIILQTNYLNTIINFAKENSVKNIFYTYKFANKETFTLGHNNPVFSAAQEEVKEYRDKINAIDFESRPAVLELFCINNGFIIQVKLRALWLSNLPTSKEFISQLEDKYEDKIIEINNKRQKENSLLKQELEQILLNNKEFATCTNQKLRENFMNKFLSKLENLKYEDIFRTSNGYLNSYELQKFTDTVFYTYKQNLKSNKQPQT